MLKTLKRIWNSEAVIENIIIYFLAIVFYQGKIFKTWKIYYKNKGVIKGTGHLHLGYLSNTLAMDIQKGRGVFIVYKNGVLNYSGLVRIARTCKVYVAGELTIGDGTYINPNTLILVRKSIHIGEQCAISWNCQIIDDDFHSIDNKTASKPIHIGNHVWIGAGATILKGVTIGDHAVIAAGTIVTKDVPAHSLMAGNPGVIVKTTINWK